MDQITASINSILTMSETSAIIKIILIFVTVGFSFFMAFKAKKIKIEKARTQEAEDRAKIQAATIKQNASDNQQIQSDSQRADDFLKGGKNGRS